MASRGRLSSIWRISVVKERRPFRPSWIGEIGLARSENSRIRRPVAHPVAQQAMRAPLPSGKPCRYCSKSSPSPAVPMMGSHVLYPCSLPFRDALVPLVQNVSRNRIAVQPPHRAFTSCRRGTYSTGSACCMSQRSTSCARNRQHRRPPILKPRRRPARASLRIVPSLHTARAAAPCTSSHGVPDSSVRHFAGHAVLAQRHRRDRPEASRSRCVSRRGTARPCPR